MKTTDKKVEINAIHNYLDWANQGKSGFIRYLIGSLLIISISLIFGQIFSIVGAILIPSQELYLNIIKITFFGFIFSFITIPIVQHLLHKRPWWSIAMPIKKIFYKDFFIGFISVLLVNFIITGINFYFNPEKYEYSNVDFNQWTPMFFLAFIAFFVQTSVEEMVYRGYITQFIYNYTKNPILFLLIPAIIFSFPHFGNISSETGVLSLIPYVIFGLFFGYIAYKAGNLWMSIGVHLANNWFVTMFIGNKAEKIQKLPLFYAKSINSSINELILSTIISCVIILLTIEVMKKITNYNNKS